jgi:hypothetical protein
MQSELDILRDVTGQLDRAAVPYVLTGSFALNHYAPGRAAGDKDIVVALPSRDTSLIARLFGPHYYVSLETVQDGLSRQSLFCVRQERIIKVDCIVRKHDEFRAAELQRRRKIRIREFEIWIASREDLIISELALAHEAHPAPELREVRHLVANGCDQAYIQRWTGMLGIRPVWEQCLGL